MFERSYTIDVYSNDKLVNRDMFDTTDDARDYLEVDIALAWAPFEEEDLVSVLDDDGETIPKLTGKRRDNTRIIEGLAYEDDAIVPWRVELTEV